MAETFPNPNAHEARPFEPTPREFGVEDVVNVQRYLQRLHDKSAADGANYVPNPRGLYDELTEAGEGGHAQEPAAAESSFDKPVNALLTEWGRRQGIAAPAPRSLQETRDLFTANPGLNDKSPIHFQGGAEYETGRFVHVMTGRAMGKAREPIARRYYLNPRADKMGQVVEQLTGAALQNETPLYFKFVNVATGTPSRRTLERTDRVVVYASDQQTGLIEDLLAKMAADDPDAFAGRKVAGFGETLADGMTSADEVTAEQNDRFKGASEGTSANDLRSKMVFEATMQVTKDLISVPQYADVRVGDKTIRQTYASELSKAISKVAPNTVVSENDPLLQEAMRLNFDPDQLKASGKFSDNAIRAISNSVATVARDVLPKLAPESLALGYDHHIKRLAPKYGVDPNNLAKNIPIAA